MSFDMKAQAINLDENQIFANLYLRTFQFKISFNFKVGMYQSWN